MRKFDQKHDPNWQKNILEKNIVFLSKKHSVLKRVLKHVLKQGVLNAPTLLDTLQTHAYELLNGYSF